MAANPFSRSTRSPVARFNSSETSESEIKAQLQSAQKIQNAQRLRQSQRFWHPKPTRSTSTIDDADVQLSASLGWTTIQDRPDSVSTIRDDATPLDRTFSFDSVSISQRMEEAARQARYRDSPVSACNTDRIPVEREADEPCPPLVYTPKQNRKDEKEYKKSLRKQRTQEEKSSSRVRTLQTNVAETGSNASTPKRSASDPAYRRPRDFAAQLIQKMKGSKSTKLSRPRSSPAAPPHVGDFKSKAELQQYLSSPLPETVVVNQPPASIAELPGSLPAYTPYQPPITETSYPSMPGTANPPNNTLQRTTSSPGAPCCNPAPRMMRCDNCQFGIKHESLYLQCLICNHGDRILCDACDSSGYSCRHQLIRKRRNYLQEVDGIYRSTSNRSPSPTRLQGGSASLVDRTRSSHHTATETDVREHGAPPKGSNSQEAEHHAQALQLQQREQDLTRRERDADFREREGLLRVREAEITSREKNVEVKQNNDMMRSCIEMAMSLGAQFASISRTSSNASSTSGSPTPAVPDPYFPGSRGAKLDHTADGIRQHAASKRKAEGKSQASSRSNSKHQQSPGDKPDDDEQEEGETAGGLQKKLKRDAEAAASEGKLYACHYCKYDTTRYSDCNNTEKHYRGCSSGFWTDISRLKQHLYRVHWQAYRRCSNCWVSFKSEDEISQHQRELGCVTVECPFPEKFDSRVYAELHKKRPKTSPEEVWYIIWDNLFPGVLRPSSPYTDQTTGQPVLSDQTNRQALAQLLGERLSQHSSIQTGLSAELRAFVLDQLWASMADLTAQNERDATSSAAPTPSNSERQRNGPANPPRLSIPHQRTPSFGTASQPVSAVSSASTTDSRWHNLPAHRQSFSRPLMQPLSHEEVSGPGSQAESSALPPALDEAANVGHFFNVPTAYDPTDHGWGEGGDSWQEGDEAGLAMTTPDFDFQFQPLQSSNLQMSVQETLATEFSAPLPLAPVNVRSLENPTATIQSNGIPIATQLQSKQQSEFSLDSGYGSRGSGSPVRRRAKGSWNHSQRNPPKSITVTPQSNFSAGYDKNVGAYPPPVEDCEQYREQQAVPALVVAVDDPVADSSIDWNALTSWQEFMEPNDAWDNNEEFSGITTS